jgi:predicted MFS family arabinose efflux permease
VLITVAGPTVLARQVQATDRSRAMALWSCFMPTGIALAMLTGPWFGGWHSLWAAAALGSGAIAVLVLWTVPRAMDTHGAAAGLRARIAELGRGPALALAITFLLYSLMFFALFSFLPVLLQQRLQVEASTVGLLAALASAANIVGNLAAGALLPRLGRTVLGTAAAAAMGLCALGIFVPVLPPWAAFVLCLVFSAMGGLVPSSLLSSVPQVTATPAHAALAVGLLMQGSNLGQALGPLLVGRVVDRHGWPAAAVCVALAALAMGVTVRWRAAAGRP